MFNTFQGEGVGGTLRNLCDHIANDPATGKNSSSKGWAATRGVDFVIKRLQSGTALKNATGNLEGQCGLGQNGQPTFGFKMMVLTKIVGRGSGATNGATSTSLIQEIIRSCFQIRTSPFNKITATATSKVTVEKD